MEPPKFVIEASEAKSMAAQSDLTIHQLLTTLVKPAQSLARPPISNYHVGAVGLGSSGRIFLGANLEFPGLPLHHSVHAEQFLITNLALHSEPSLTHLAVSAAPCGHCRQFLQEIRRAPDIQILITPTGLNDHRPFEPLSGFLPNRFGPDDLLNKDVPLVLEKHHNDLSLAPDKNNKRKTVVLPNGLGCSVYAELRDEAMKAANRSHAPYSKCPSGVALLDCEGKVYSGSYVESAAYNPSLGPVQAALVDYVVGGGGGGYERIVAAVLVEREGAAVRQELTARLILEVVSPKCEFKVFCCSYSGLVGNCLDCNGNEMWGRRKMRIED